MTDQPVVTYHIRSDPFSGVTAVRGPGRGTVYRLATLELTAPDPAAIDAAAARLGLDPVREPIGPGAWLRGAAGVYHLGELLARWKEQGDG